MWSLTTLLSFSSNPSDDHTTTSSSSSSSPLRTLSNHRAAITAIRAGHSTSDIKVAVSASKDSTCIIWNYQTGDVLRTFLLPSIPISLAIDPCERAVYAGFEDGSIQLVDLFSPQGLSNPLYDETLHTMPVQADSTDRWTATAQELGAALSLASVYEGNYLVSGHASGALTLWDIASRKFSRQLTKLSGAITNVITTPPTGFLNPATTTLRLHQVVKPRCDSSLQPGSVDAGRVPTSYTIQAQFPSALPTTNPTVFSQALTHPSFPPELLTFSPSVSSTMATRPLPAKAQQPTASPALQKVISTRLEAASVRHRTKAAASQEARLARKAAKLKVLERELGKRKRNRERGKEDDYSSPNESSSADEEDQSDSDSGMGEIRVHV